jgi:molybdopterin biosynthesis enzyme
VLPALLKIQGLSTSLTLRFPLENVTPLPRFSWLLPVAVAANGQLIPRPPRNSGDYVSIAGAMGIVEIPPENDFTSGQSFAYHPFP